MHFEKVIGRLEDKFSPHDGNHTVFGFGIVLSEMMTR